MSRSDRPPMSVIRRMPRYYRILCELSEGDIARISSGELSSRMGLTASQIRQDFNRFGDFGQQGYGYNVSQLRSEVGKILGVDELSPAILIGVGNMGRAIVNSLDFEQKGVALAAIVDVDPHIVGQTVRGLTVCHATQLTAICRHFHPKIAILCVPNEQAAELVRQLTALGVTAFWNFSHYDIPAVNPDVAVENVHLGDSLLTLSCRLKQQELQKQAPTD